MKKQVEASSQGVLLLVFSGVLLLVLPSTLVAMAFTFSHSLLPSTGIYKSSHFLYSPFLLSSSGYLSNHPGTLKSLESLLCHCFITVSPL